MGGVSKGRLHLVNRQGMFLGDRFGGLSGRDRANHSRDVHPRARDAGLSEADIGVHRDTFVPRGGEASEPRLRAASGGSSGIYAAGALASFEGGPSPTAFTARTT
jgi:hypothetical protein